MHTEMYEIQYIYVLKFIHAYMIFRTYIHTLLHAFALLFLISYIHTYIHTYYYLLVKIPTHTQPIYRFRQIHFTGETKVRHSQ